MQIRVSAFITSHLEAIQQKLEYERVSDVFDLMLDSIKHQWSLNLQYMPQSGTNVLKLRLTRRHVDWITQFGAERGISATAATNLILSEHFRGKKLERVTPSLPVMIKPLETQSATEEKPRGKQLLKSLKL